MHNSKMSLNSLKFGKASIIMLLSFIILSTTLFIPACSKKNDPDDYDLLTGSV